MEENMLIIIIRSVLLYILIVFALRLMGKKQLAQLQPSELVTTILISNIATLSLEDSTVPMIYGVIPILMIVCMDVFMSFIMLKNSRFRRLVTGTPQIIITDGIIDRKVMKHLRYSVDELMEAMRECMIFDISQVQYAIVETTGKINFYQKSRYRNVENGDVGVQVTNCDPPCLLIKDGEINYPGLRRWNGDEAKLREIIKSMKLDIKDIFLLTDSTDKGIYTVLKSNDKYGTKPIAMVAFALYGYNYSDTCARRIYLAADEITQAVDKNDTAKAIEKADLAEQLWRKMSQHTIFVEDTECDNEIAMSLARIKVFAENGEDDIYSECAVLKRLIELYITRQQITPASVF